MKSMIRIPSTQLVLKKLPFVMRAPVSLRKLATIPLKLENEGIQIEIIGENATISKNGMMDIQPLTAKAIQYQAEGKRRLLIILAEEAERLEMTIKENKRQKTTAVDWGLPYYVMLLCFVLLFYSGSDI